jgi:hypothetical protein
MVTTCTRFTGMLTAAVFAFASAAPAFAGQDWSRNDDRDYGRNANDRGSYEVTCRSQDYAENQCQIDRANRVELLQQISSSACDEGETWRYDAQTIYVREGCGARFLVTPQNYNDGNYRDGEVRGKKSDNTGTIVAAAVIGGLLLYALTSGGKNKREPRNRQPNRQRNNSVPQNGDWSNPDRRGNGSE